MNIVVFILLLFGAVRINSIPASSVNNKVIGSIVASIEKFPYQTAIFAQQETVAVFCSGAILSANFVVTAAHCLVGSHNASVFYGSGKLSALDFDRNQVIPSSNYRIHPKYTTFFNDIALIELLWTIEFSGKYDKKKLNG